MKAQIDNNEQTIEKENGKCGDLQEKIEGLEKVKDEKKEVYEALQADYLK